MSIIMSKEYKECSKYFKDKNSNLWFQEFLRIPGNYDILSLNSKDYNLMGIGITRLGSQMRHNPNQYGLLF